MSNIEIGNKSDNLAIVICEARDAKPAERALQGGLTDLLAQQPGVELAVLPHLYDLAPRGPAMRYLQAVPGDLVVLGWLSPRAAFWVLDANGVKGRMGDTSFLPAEQSRSSKRSRHGDAADRTIWCIDLRACAAAEPIVREIERIRGANHQVAGKITRLDEPAVPRWYPVIDLDRCQNCLECLNFCLFGAYGLDDEGKIFVEQPDACRDGCPACARICPACAILFPADRDPAIAGDDSAAASRGSIDLAAPATSADIQKLAEAERQRALSQDSQAAGEAVTRAAGDDLDRLVDELDQTDL